MEADYSVAETDGTVDVEVAVLSGTLSSNVTVELQTRDGSAVGTYVCTYMHVQTPCMESLLIPVCT